MTVLSNVTSKLANQGGYFPFAGPASIEPRRLTGWVSRDSTSTEHAMTASVRRWDAVGSLSTRYQPTGFNHAIELIEESSTRLVAEPPTNRWRCSEALQITISQETMAPPLFRSQNFWPIETAPSKCMASGMKSGYSGD
jgi:hypothetical protein